MAYPLVIKRPEVISRLKLRTQLERLGIETRPLFGCIPTQQPAYASFREKYSNKLPIADFLGLNGFYIGCHQYLTDSDLAYVVECFRKALGDL